METQNLIFEWDEQKRKRNFNVHGIDFTDAIDVITDPNVSIELDVKKDYGEERFNAYGISDGRHIRLCFTWRGENIVCVISMFRVHEKEWRKHYENN